MFQQAIIDLCHGFGVALEPHNLMWSLFGVLVGNMVGVLPGLGALSAISILLPLTANHKFSPFGMNVVSIQIYELGNTQAARKEQLYDCRIAQTLFVGCINLRKQTTNLIVVEKCYLFS